MSTHKQATLSLSLSLSLPLSLARSLLSSPYPITTPLHLYGIEVTVICHIIARRSAYMGFSKR
jgi:hypothetical protein